MPTPMHDPASQGQLQQNIGTSAPPAYSDSQVWIVALPPCDSGQWAESPPAYDTLTDLPLWCVIPPESRLNPPAAIPQRCRPPQAASHDASSNVSARYASRGLVNNTPTAQQDNTRPTIHVRNVSSNSPTRNPRIVNTTENSVYITRFFEKKKCNPKKLGWFLSLVVFVQVGNAIVLSFESNAGSRSLSSGIIFWAPLFYLFTGPFTALASLKPTVCKVKTFLSLNLVSLAISCVGLALSILDLQDLQDPKNLQNLQNLECSYFQSMCKQEFTGTYIPYYILIVSNVLVIILSLLTASVSSYTLHLTSKRCPPQGTFS
ncbi:uncharacterized protein LOC143930362 isoform X2 [Lithobates pipiens]